MPAHIVSDNKEFIGEALYIYPLRQKLFSIDGDIEEGEVLKLAEQLFSEYQNILRHKKDEWRDIKDIKFPNATKSTLTIKASRRHLKRFISKFKGNIVKAKV